MFELEDTFNLEINGKRYLREYELLGDVQKVRWYEYNESLYTSEIYTQDMLDILELEYEIACMNDITPPLPII